MDLARSTPQKAPPAMEVVRSQLNARLSFRTTDGAMLSSSLSNAPVNRHAPLGQDPVDLAQKKKLFEPTPMELLEAKRARKRELRKQEELRQKKEADERLFQKKEA